MTANTTRAIFIDNNIRCQLQQSRSSLKANVFCQFDGCQAVVIKDYSHANRLMRSTICRLLLSREIRALKILDGIHGVPKYIKRYGQYGFAMQAISGTHPRIAGGDDSDQLLTQLQDRVDTLHSHGITHNDLRTKNMMIDERGILFLIDFASAHFQSRGRNILSVAGNYLFARLMITDQAKVLRLKQKSNTRPMNTAEHQIIMRGKRLHRIADLWQKILYPGLWGAKKTRREKSFHTKIDTI